MKEKDTKKNTSVRYIIFKEDSVWHGVALEFNLVKDASNPVEAMFALFNAIEGYASPTKSLQPDSISLNQKTEEEYENMWNILQSEKGLKRQEIYAFGYKDSFYPLSA